MFSGKDLKEYRVMEGLSQRDVERYCDISHEAIGMVERGENNVTEYNYREIIKGINGAIQAKARGTFEVDKAKDRAEVVAKEKAKAEEKAKLEQVSKATPKKKTTTKKPTKAANTEN